MFGGKKLNKKDRKHLRENKIFSKYKFEQQVEFLKNEQNKYPDRPYGCYHCLTIAKKLGMWNDIKK